MELNKYKNNLINQKKKFLKNKINQINQNIKKKISKNYRLKRNLNIQRKKNIQNWIRKINYEIKLIRDMKRLPQKNALLIGINYIGTVYQLYGCINDTEDIQQKLIQKNYNIIMMNDNSNDNLKPTKENVLQQIKVLLNNSYYGDKLFIYYSGHGSQINDKNNEESDDKDEVIVTLGGNYITDDSLQLLLNQYMKDFVTLNIVMDCCCSGTLFDLRYQHNNGKIVINNKYRNIKGNVCLISGCRDNESSYEAYINNKTSGALTSTLLKYLYSNFTYNQLLNKVINELKNNNFNQNPQLSSGFKFNSNKRKLIL